MNSVRKNTISSRILIAVLAVALVFTMMPLSMGVAFAADEADYQPALTITGLDGTKKVYQTREDVINAFGSIDDTSFDVALKGIAVKRLLKDLPDDAVVTVQTQDNYDKLNANGKTVKELKENKGLLAYQEGDTKYDPTSDELDSKGRKLYGGYFKFYVGKDSTGKALVDKWVNRITISEGSGGDDPQPVEEAVLSVKGEGLAKELSYESIKTVKNDEAIKPLIKENVTFHTKNSYDIEEEFVVSGVRIEDLINLAGLKEGMELDSVKATADDGYSKVYTADMIRTEDADGNKAMFIWSENGDKVQKTAIGQVCGLDNNRGYWVGGKTIALTVTTKATAPAKVTGVAAKNLKGKKVKVTWKKAENAKTYQVAYKLKSSKKWTTKSTKNLSYTVKKLKKGKTYQFKVRGVSADKVKGKWSAVKSVQIKK